MAQTTRRSLLTGALALPLAAQNNEQGFVTLFDGRTLAGWSVEAGPQTAFSVRDGSIVGEKTSRYPAWLRSANQYENFDFRGEFFVRGWTDGGIFLHAPEHGRCTWVGLHVKIFHQRDREPRSNSMGAIFPVLPPTKVNVRGKGAWNTFRTLMDWPRLRVWVNGELVQDLDLDATPELRHRLRSGYLGLSSLGYRLRFRNLRIRLLPGKERWVNLFETDQDRERNWFVSESHKRAPLRFESANAALRAEGIGHIATKAKYRDFELQLYVRGPRHHNGGVLFRTDGKGLAGKRYYEVQLHNVADAHYPTGSLYHHQRAIYPRIEDGEWFPMQLIVQGRRCLVRINGDTVVDHNQLEHLDAGHIELQAHQAGSWLEFKHVRVKRL